MLSPALASAVARKPHLLPPPARPPETDADRRERQLDRTRELTDLNMLAARDAAHRIATRDPASPEPAAADPTLALARATRAVTGIIAIENRIATGTPEPRPRQPFTIPWRPRPNHAQPQRPEQPPPEDPAFDDPAPDLEDEHLDDDLDLADHIAPGAPSFAAAPSFATAPSFAAAPPFATARPSYDGPAPEWSAFARHPDPITPHQRL